MGEEAFFFVVSRMNGLSVVLLSIFIVYVAAQGANGFDPPSALSNPSPPSAFSPVSPVSAATYTVSQLSPQSPAPFSVVTLPSVFSAGSGPFSPYTKIPAHLLHKQHLSPIPSLSPFSIPDFSPFPPLFGSHGSADMIQVSMTVLVACV